LCTLKSVRSEMKRLSVFAFVSIIGTLSIGLAFNVQGSQDTPPSLYVSKGACPFEGCVYRDWTAKKDLDVYDRPGGNLTVDHIRKGEWVRAVTGEVHCQPLRVVATRNHPEAGSYEPTSPPIKQGQVYFLLHYLGEGQWKVWFRGAVTIIEGRPPDAPKPTTTWWAEVRTVRGITGWVIATDNFDGQDMLAKARPSSSQIGD
jgi:hypothetical protein